MNNLKRYLKVFKNFYLVVGGAALVWMLFFDRYNVVARIETQVRIGQLESDLDFYQQEKGRIEEARSVLENSPQELEKYAREEFRMKKDNEDLFILTE
ncbi:MAG: septum formation initiator family protein [Bacteroidota bacterium]